MRQISIFDILNPKPEPKQEKVTSTEWLKIPQDAEIKLWSIMDDYTDDIIGKVAEGRVNGAPSLIGYVEYVSGPGEIYHQWLPKYYKPFNIPYSQAEVHDD